MTVANLWLWFPLIGTSERTQMFAVMHSSQHTYAIVCINTVAGQTGKKKLLGPPSPPIDGRNPAPISRRMGYFFSPFLAGRLPMVQHFSLSKKIFELGQ
jgi:hypothetical protein